MKKIALLITTLCFVMLFPLSAQKKVDLKNDKQGSNKSTASSLEALLGSADPDYDTDDWDTVQELAALINNKSENDEETAITIKVKNVDRADIYLNGIYRGESDLVLKNLRPGYYNLKVKKSGYETFKSRIRVRSGRSIVYEIKMEKLYGYLRINNGLNVSNLQPGEVPMDTSITKMDIGTHSLSYTRFGYYDINRTVTILPYLTTDIQVIFQPCPFEVSDFSSSGSKMNPYMKGGYSSITFSYRVTANGTTRLVITDKYGSIHFAKEFTNFRQHHQSFSYDGMDDYGVPLADGEYIATLEAEGQSWTRRFTVDSTISYGLVPMGYNGLSIGDVTTGISDMGFQFSWYNGFTPIIRLNSNQSPFIAGWTSNFDFMFARHMELYINLFGNPGKNVNRSTGVNIGAKFFSQIPLGDSNVTVGAVIRGPASLVRPYGNASVDGNGELSGGMFTTFENSGTKIGVDVNAVFSNNLLLKAGIGSQFKLTDRSAASVSLSVMAPLDKSGDVAFRGTADYITKGMTDVFQFDLGMFVTADLAGRLFIAPKAAIVLVF